MSNRYTCRNNFKYIRKEVNMIIIKNIANNDIRNTSVDERKKTLKNIFY